MRTNRPISDETFSTRLDTALVARLRSLIGRLRRFLLVEGLAWCVASWMAGCVLLALLDYGSGGLQWSMRAVLLAALIATITIMVWRHLVSPLSVPCGLAEAAGLVERRNPHLASTLVSAVRFGSGEMGPSRFNSPQLAAAVMRSASNRVEGIDFKAVLDPTRSRRGSLSLMVMLAAVAVAVLGWPEFTQLWFSRNILLRNIDWPRQTRLIVDLPGAELKGAKGDDLVVEAYAEGVQPDSVDILFQNASGDRGRETMVTVGSRDSYRYRFTFKNVQEDFHFHLRGGDDRTRDYSTHLVERPRALRTEMTIRPPSYTGANPYILGDGERSAQILMGSSVSLAIEPSKPLARATLMSAREKIAEAIFEDGMYRAPIEPRLTTTYHFELVDEEGFENRQQAKFALRVTKDEGPKLRIKLPGVGDMVTPEAILPIELEFADTYGLAEVKLWFRSGQEGSEPQNVPLNGFSATSKTFATSLVWPVSESAVPPGERVILHSTARDFDDVSGPNESKSGEIVLRMVTPEELQAELARREQEYRMDYERLVDGQEQLRGRLLSQAGRLGQGAPGAELAKALGPLERSQRNIVGSVNVTRQQFEQILTEMRINQLSNADVEQRIGKGIVEPLADLVRRNLTIAADTIRAWSRDGSLGQASLVDQQQSEITKRMRLILANMLEWEGYQEVVNMLREIIRLQTELNKETSQLLEERAKKVFED